MKKSTILIWAFTISLIGCTSSVDKPLYRDSTKSTEERIEDLLRRMSLEEKIHLLISETDTNAMQFSVGRLGFLDNGTAPSKSAYNYNSIARYMKEKTKYGIVAFRAGEGIFAYMGYGSTAFPQPLAQAASWNPDVVRTVAGIVAEEAKSRGVRLLYSPVLNIGRDPRWGRTGETYGEDPYLISQMGVAYIQTIQSKGVAATMKHFAGNTGHDGKFGASVFYSERYYREFELPPYEAGIKEAGVQAVMMAYNTGDGIPFAQNKKWMKDYLKNELGFKGVIMSDGGGLRLIDEAFGLDTSNMQITAKCINAGCDWGLDNPKYYKTALLKAVEKGLVDEATITEAARRTLRIMFNTGLFDQPYVDTSYARIVNDCQAHRKVALEVALQTIVLLKNEKSTLPFNKKLRKIFVTGQLANQLLINHYGGWGRKEVTVLEGLKNLLPNTEVVYKTGAYVGYTFFPPVSNKIFYHYDKGSKKSGLKAEYFNNASFDGEPNFREVASQINYDWGMGSPANLPPDNFSVKWQGYFTAPYTGNFTFGAHADDGLSVYINDSLVVDMNQGTQNAIFIAKGIIFLEKGKEYRIKALYKEKGGKAYARLGWDADIYREIPQAVQEAKKSDAIIAVVGMYDDENGDRAILNLDEAQETLILELAKLEKPMVVVLQTGNVITMRRWADKVAAIIHAWYPGEEGGNAIAKILFGDYNPGGKLPITIPIETGQVPLNYNRFPGKDTKAVDRGLDQYFDVGNEPMFPFGHGLSYTQFELMPLKLSGNTLASTDSLIVEVPVKNTGPVAGHEVIQLYVHDVEASVSRPVKELKAFQKLHIEPGETKIARLTLKSSQLYFYNEKMEKIWEPGYIKLMVGTSSTKIIHTEWIRLL